MAATVYQEQLNSSVQFIGSAVSDLQERLRDQRGRLEALQAKRDGGANPSEEEKDLEKLVTHLEARADAMTAQLEEATRDLIDYKVELEDNSRIVADLSDAAAANPPPSQHDLEDADVKDDAEAEAEASRRGPGPTVVEQYQALRSQTKSDYEALPMHQRYAQNNDYAAFKKLWHDAMVGEGGPPLPDSSRWFRPDGQPNMLKEHVNSNDEISISRELMSILCPLSLLPMKEPYANRICKHHVDKASILDYLPVDGREVQCPHVGCSAKFSRARFDQEFYPDQAMARRIQRRLQAQHEVPMDLDDDLKEEAKQEEL